MHTQKSNLGNFIELFELETDSNIFRFTNNAESISWDGRTFEPAPCEITGISYSYTAPVQPTLSVGQINKFMFTQIVNDDLVGASLTRYRTFQEILGTPSEAMAEERFIIKSIKTLNKQQVSLSLGSVIDKNNIKIPRKLVLQKDFPGIKSVSTL